jgi:hypothetical protein
MRQRGQHDRLNIKTMIIHSVSFGLFLLSISLWAAAYVVYLVQGAQGKGSFLLDLMSTVLQVCSFASQCLLCVIFL